MIACEREKHRPAALKNVARGRETFLQTLWESYSNLTHAMIKTLNSGTQVTAVRGVPASIGLQRVNDPTVGCGCSILQLYGSSQKISHATKTV